MTTGYNSYRNRVKTPVRMSARITIDLIRFKKDVKSIGASSYNVNNFYPTPIPGTPPSADLCDISIAYQLLITSNDTCGNLEPAYYYDDADVLQTVPDAILTTESECDAIFDWHDFLRYSKVVIGDGAPCFILHDENHIAEAFTYRHVLLPMSGNVDWINGNDTFVVVGGVAGEFRPGDEIIADDELNCPCIVTFFDGGNVTIDRGYPGTTHTAGLYRGLWIPEIRDSIVMPVMDELTGLPIPNKLMACTLQYTNAGGFANGFRILPVSWSLDAEVELLQYAPGEAGGES